MSVLIRSCVPLQPFGLSAEPKGRVVAVTADGAGGEKVGDILRFTTQWKGQEPVLCDVCKIMERQLQNSFRSTDSMWTILWFISEPNSI